MRKEKGKAATLLGCGSEKGEFRLNAASKNRQQPLRTRSSRYRIPVVGHKRGELYTLRHLLHEDYTRQRMPCNADRGSR